MSPFKIAMTWLFGIGFEFAGIAHFLRPVFYVRIMPPYLPWHLELVYLSGIIGAYSWRALLIPRCTVLAAWGLIALLVAVFPANVHMALNTDLYSTYPPLVLWLRLPLQGALIAWAYWLTRRTG